MHGPSAQDPQESPVRTRGPVHPAVSAALITLAAFGTTSAAMAQGPAPGNGSAIFRDAGPDVTAPADGTTPPVDTGVPVAPTVPAAPTTTPTTTTDAPPVPPAPEATPDPAPAATPTHRPARKHPHHEQVGAVEVAPAPDTDKPHKKHKRKHKHKHHEHADQTPDATAPTQVAPDLTAPKTAHVPDPVLERFDIPPFLLPVYQAAAVTYQVPWTVLAAINSVETDYGRNTNVSSAGALGWMQFMPATWKMYGVDANVDGKKDPYNPADAIFAAARDLHAAGADKDLRGAIFSYNHAGWYVDEVLSRAKALSEMPADVVDSLTGLAQARLPIPGKHVHVEKKLGPRRWVNIDAPTGRRVVAAADGKVLSLGRDKRLGQFVVIEDAYGNRFTYAHLGSVEARYAVPRKRTVTEEQIRRELHLPRHDRKPHAPATANKSHGHSTVHDVAIKATVAPAPKPAHEVELLNDLQVMRNVRLAGPLATPSQVAVAARAIGLKPRQVTMRKLLPGAHVVAGTIIGHVAFRSHGHAAPVRFAVRPGGHNPPRVDSRPLLKGWRLLQSTAVYGPAGTSSLNAKGRLGLGQALLMGKDALAQRVLNDPRIKIYECGRQDIEAGQIDRRVLAVLEFLADSGMNPTVTALECGHSLMTTSGNISEHSTGDAVDIAAINGVPIAGHQGPGSLTDTVVRRLLELQGTMKPHQIITLMSYPGTDNTLSLPDHWDHIHVGFHPDGSTGGTNSVTTSLAPAQWSKLMGRLREIHNPRVSTHVSRFAIKAKHHASE
jgi:murein DD-endopeptidase MepM/ murein hydrolase activator NlpD